MRSRAHDSWAGGNLGAGRDLPLGVYPRVCPSLPFPSLTINVIALAVFRTHGATAITMEGHLLRDILFPGCSDP